MHNWCKGMLLGIAIQPRKPGLQNKESTQHSIWRTFFGDDRKVLKWR
jgi:hypothetical protein